MPKSDNQRSRRYKQSPTPPEESGPPSAPTANGQPSDVQQPGDTQQPGAIEQAAELRDALREAAASANRLVTMLKRQQKASRLMHSTLASLRQLQSLDA